MSELRKKLKKNENVELVAFKTNNGIAIGKKNPNGFFCDAVVVVTERKDGTIEVVINKDVDANGNPLEKDGVIQAPHSHIELSGADLVGLDLPVQVVANKVFNLGE